MTALICLAIAERKYMTFFYDGAYRTVEPHAHGLDQRGGEILLAYQVEAYGVSSEPQGWKPFAAARIQKAQMLDLSFPGGRADYNPEGSLIAKFCCRLPGRRLPPLHDANPGERDPLPLLSDIDGKAEDTLKRPDGTNGSD